MNVYFVDFNLDKSILKFGRLAPNVYISQDWYISYMGQFTGTFFTSSVVPGNHFVYLQTYYVEI